MVSNFFPSRAQHRLCLNNAAGAAAGKAVGSESRQENQCKPNDFGELHGYKLAVAVIHQNCTTKSENNIILVFLLLQSKLPLFCKLC